jgi:hypothetical protein
MQILKIVVTYLKVTHFAGRTEGNSKIIRVAGKLENYQSS